MPLMGIREYARHRKGSGLAGGSQTAVQYAIKSGRITEALVRVTGEPHPKVDSEAADKLWADRSATHERIDRKPGGDHAPVTKTQKPAAPLDGEAAGIARTQDEEDAVDLDSASYATARAARERANARLAQLQLAEREGRLVDAEAAAGAWEKIIKTSCTKVLALPSKIRARLPHLTVQQVALIEGLVRESLEELAGGATA
jgi:hypothetical protein